MGAPFLRWFSNLRAWAQKLLGRTLAVFLAAKDRRTPVLAKVVSAATALYALSPIDLIPDFIPFLGSLDDLIIVPAGLCLAIRLIPPDVMADALAKAQGFNKKLKLAKIVGGVLVVALWLLLLIWAVRWTLAWRASPQA